MSITWIAAILIPVGLYGFFVSPRLLYHAFIFSVPFSATAVANVGSSDSASGVSASMFFGSLCIARYIITMMVEPKSPPAVRGLETPTRLLMLFFATCALSLIMPIILDGKLVISSANLDRNNSAIEHLSSRNVTALLYLAFGCLAATYFARIMSDAAVMARSIRVYIRACVLLSGWGLMQWILVTAGFRYPDYILNTSATKTAQGFGDNLTEAHLARISSAAVEPSLFAQVVLIALAILVISGSLNMSVLSKKADLICGSIIALTLLLSTSTEAVAGLLVIGACYLAILMLDGRLSPRPVILAFCLFFAGVVAFLTVPAVNSLVDNVLLSKASSYSAQERLNSVRLAVEYFKQYPILGIGWGVVTSQDLIVNLASNAGLLGLFSFLTYVGVVARRGLRGFFKQRLDPLQVAIFVAFAVMLLMNSLTGFAYVFQHVWFVAGAATAASCAVVRGKKTTSNQLVHKTSVLA